MNSDPAQTTVMAEAVALFGKRSGASDYEWLTGPTDVPEHLVRLAARISSATDIPVAIAESSDRPWIVRSFTGGVDYAHRPVVNTEILRLTSAFPLPEHLLLLASATLRLPASPSMSLVPITIGALTAQPVPPSDDQERHARVGAALSVSPPAALFIAREGPWRYDGFCYARSSGVRWDPELARYLCINVAPPFLTNRDEALLRAADAIPADEWPLLQRLSRTELQDVLLWMGGTESKPLPAASDDVLAWLVKRSSSKTRGGVQETIRAVTSAIGDNDAAPRVLSAVAAELPDDVRATFFALMTGDEERGSVAHLEHLSRAGYLDLLPAQRRHLWMRHAASSQVLADAALDHLTRYGFSPQQAAFLLDLPMHHGDSTEVSGLIDALRRAAPIGLPEPVRRLRDLFRNIGLHDFQTLCDERAFLLPWARRIIDAATEEQQPFHAETDEDRDIVLTLRALLTSKADALLGVTQSIVLTGDLALARRFFSSRAAAAEISVECEALVAARLGGPPAAVLPSIKEIERLKRADLVRAEDLDLRHADRATTRALATLWPETTPFGLLLEDRWTRAPHLPAAWLPAARKFLKPKDLMAVAASLSPEQSDEFLGWICQVHGLDFDLVTGLREGDASLVAGRDVARLGEWLGIIFPETDRHGEGATLAHLVGSRIAQGDAKLARQIVSAFVPAASRATDEWLVYVLCGRGPMPVLKNVAPRMVAQLVSHLDAVELIDALVLADGVEAANDPDVIAAVCRRVEQIGASCPQRGYSEAQAQRAPLLMARLSQLPGWETVTGPPESRRRIATRTLHILGLTAEDLVRMVHEGEGK
jgi:hypothetical protein